MLLVDEAGAVVLVNRDAAALFGCPIDRLLERSLGEQLSTPDARPFAVDDPTDDAHHPLYGPGVELLVQRPDGERLAAHVGARRVTDPGGSLVALVLINAARYGAGAPIEVAEPRAPEPD